MRKRILAMFAAVFAALALTSSPAAATASADPGDVAAAAYSTRVEQQDTDFCPCPLIDDWDDTYFEHDADAWAVKLTLYTSGGDIAGKVEFHPQGEYFYVYDTLTDGVSVTARLNGTTYSSRGGTPYNLAFAEGSDVLVALQASNNTSTAAMGVA